MNVLRFDAFALALQQQPAANMKYLHLILLLFLSQFTNGQNSPRVVKSFDNVSVFDDFSYITNRWNQKNSATERMIISDGRYRIERLKNTYFTISLAKDVANIEAFDVITSLEVERSKANKDASGGLVLKAQPTGSSALIVEINAKKQYRILMMRGGSFTALFSEKNDGWIKAPSLNKKGYNEIRVVTNGAEYDLYFNSEFVRSFIITSLKTGGIGYYAGAQSAINAKLFIIKTDGTTPLSPVKPQETKPREDEPSKDDTYVELVKVFKAKIDKQQNEIETLTEELSICKANLAIDTTSANKVKQMKTEMEGLKNRVQTMEAKLESTKKRLAYLESMKEDIESQDNGDLILHLTQLLSDKKDENEKLKAEKAELLRQIGELRRRN